MSTKTSKKKPSGWKHNPSVPVPKNPPDSREYYKRAFEILSTLSDKLQARDREIESTARQVIAEVRSLRRRNEVLEAQDRVLGLVGALLFTSPPDDRRGACVDDVWSLEKLLDNKE